MIINDKIAGSGKIYFRSIHDDINGILRFDALLQDMLTNQ
jgi:hypothetical protein